MKHNRVSKISYLVVIGILLCVVANSILAAAMETDVTQGGYNENASVDLPGDGPPENITRPITRIRLPSENIKRFKTDTAPELDWYQPCNGGDNLINFYINVHDVDVSTIKSAKLTLAVWDVDYVCGSACNGICERDTVYINGHRLMTPEPYLTGANNQWSTCTFNVDPEWIIEGDNYVEIFIDLWSGECWCVECDWGELGLELVDVKVVEIDALKDIDIRDKDENDITDPIWNYTKPSEYDPVADAMKNRFIFWTYPGALKIKATLDAFPTKPSWEPKCRYAWWISGTSKYGTGEFTGWSGEFKVDMPQEVGKYTLTLAFTLYDDENNEINFQYMKHDLYVTYKNSRLPKPKTTCLDYATEWADGASSPDSISSQLLHEIYNTGWAYGPNDYHDWQDVLTLHEGNCLSYAHLWKNMNKVLGIHKETRSIHTSYEVRDLGNNIVTENDWYGYITNALRCLDGEEKEWDFTYHQVGWSEVHDPTFNIQGGLEDYEEDLMKEWKQTFNDGTNATTVTISGSDIDTLIDTKDVTTTFTLSGATYTLEVWLNDGGTAFPDPPVSSATEPANITTIQTDKLSYETNEPIFITSFTALDGIIGKGLAVEATIEGPDDTVTIDLFDDGTHGDGEPNDGTYTNIFTNTAVEGGYKISVHVTGIINGTQIERDAELPNGVLVMDIGARFGITHSDQGIDTDDNGLYNLLDVRIGLNVSNGGNYIIAGILKSNEIEITGASNITYLNLGDQTVNLNFDGTSIRKSELNGPYTIRVELYDENYNQIDYGEFNTSAYSYTDFQNPQAEFTGTYSDYGTDISGDGAYDYLTIEAEVNAITAGNYSITGWLYDGGGNEIVSADNYTYLDAGTNSVLLNFDGMTIHRHGVDGPYNLSYITLYNKDDTVIDVQSDAYITSAYSYTDFQSPSASFRDTYSDYGVDTNGDGFFEYLTVEVGLNVTTAGNYSTQGCLYDIYGNATADTYNLTYLNAGDQTVTLNFDGYSIYKHGVNGSFNLTNLLLYDETGTLMDNRNYAYTTSAYDYTDFQKPSVALTGNYSDYGTDIDGDGLYDYLTIDIEVIVENAENYALNARLMDKDEDEIVWAATTSWLSAGLPQIMQLNFDGKSVNKNGVDGPYYLRDVYVYKIADVSQSDYVYDAYTTGTYNYTDFESILSTDLTNVNLISADPTVTSISVSNLNLSDVNETLKPPRVLSQSAYMINSTGAGNFTLKFTDIPNANLIRVYKIDPTSVPQNQWIKLDTTTIDMDVTFTMSAGDPPVVFAKAEHLTTLYYPDFTDTDTPGNWRTWLGIMNTGNTSTTLCLDVYNPNGSIAYSNPSFVTLEPKAAHFFRPGITAGIAQGSAIVYGDNLAGTCHVNKNGGEGTKVYTALSNASSKLYYPDFTDTDTPGNWRTWIAVMNTGDTSTTLNLTIYNPDGSIAYSNPDFVTLEPKAVHFFRPGITAGIAQGSVAVSGDNLAGTCHVNKNGGEGTKVYTGVSGDSTAVLTGLADLAYDSAEPEVSSARYGALTGSRAPAKAELNPSESITFPARLSTNELIYDDGEANKAFAWDSGCNRFAVRFTPLSYPVDLKTARICLWPNWPDGDHEMFTIEVYDDDGPGGRPGTLLGGPVSYTATDWGWNSIDITGRGITIDSGNFYIAYHQLTDYPDCEGLCTDTDEPLYGRLCDWNGSWTLWPEDNYMVRCGVARTVDALYYPDFTDTDTAGSWRTWLGVMNTGDTSTTLRLDVYNTDGSVAYSNSDFVTLDPKAVHFFRPGMTAGIAQGSAIVSGNNLAGTCHVNKNGGEGTKVYTALSNGSSTLYYPDFTDTDTSGNWRTWMGVMNTGDTSTTLRLDVYNADGSLAYSNANFVTLEPKAVHFFRPGITAGIAQGDVVVSGDNLAGTCHVNKNGGVGTKVYTAIGG